MLRNDTNLDNKHTQSQTDTYQTSQTHSWGELPILLTSGKIDKFFSHPQLVTAATCHYLYNSY